MARYHIMLHKNQIVLHRAIELSDVKRTKYNNKSNSSNRIIYNKALPSTRKTILRRKCSRHYDSNEHVIRSWHV
jgi:hypothetical protein